MKGKIAFVLGAAVGYVLGSRAGRERYEQIKRGADKVWHTAPVQRGVEAVKAVVDARAEEMKSFVRQSTVEVLHTMTKQAANKQTSVAQPAAAERTADEASAKPAATKQQPAVKRATRTSTKDNA